MTVPEGAAHPLCKMVFAEARRRCHTYEELDYVSGVQRGTMKEWRKGVSPRQFSIESVLSTLGWEFAALPDSDTIPAALRHELEAALAEFGATVPALDFLPDLSLRTN